MIVAIVLLGLMLRTINLSQSLWLDEATQAILSSKSLHSIWFDRAADFHPPLSYILFHFWLMFGRSESWLRLLPIIFGVATIWVVYKLATKLFSRKTALIASLLLATAPYHVYYSQEIRMYSMAAFFATCSVWFFIKPFKTNLLNSMGLVISLTLLIYSHYMGLFLFAALFIFAIWEKKNLVKQFLIVGILYIPWIPQFIKQLQGGVNANQYLPGWAEVLSLSPVKAIPLTFLKFSLGRVSIDNNLIYGLVALAVLSVIGFLLFIGISKIKKEQKIISVWFFIPLVLSFLISFKIPLNQPFRLLFIIPAFYILIALGISSLKKYSKIGLVLIILISFSGLFMYYTNPKFWREDWHHVINIINSEISENSLVVFSWPEPFSPYLWYQGKKGVGVVNKFPATQIDIENNLKLENIKEVYLFEYLAELSDPEKQTKAFLESKQFKIRAVYNTEGVGFVDYYTK